MKLLKTFCLLLVVLLTMFAFGLHRLNHLNSKAIEPSEFSWLDKAEVYTAYIAMNVLGAPMYPEIAMEGLLMLLPSFDGKEIVIESEFFLESAFKQDKINNYTGPVRLAWSPSDYLLGSSEARVSLALNTGILTIEDGKVRVSVPCTWPKHSDHRDHSWTTPLVVVPGLPEIRVQEGLFWVLEEEGWLSTYTAIWETDLPA